MICLAGDGWGAIAAFKSLKSVFEKVEVVTSDRKLLDSMDEYDMLVSEIQAVESQIIVCAGYKSIVNRKTLDSKTLINIHYSLLPKYRGLHSTVWAILNNEEYLGLTIHLMNEFIDDGPIIYQYKIENDGCSTATHYMQIFNDWISNNLGEILKKYIDSKLAPSMQNISEATWVGKRSYEDCKIDFNKTHLYIKNLFRALNPPYPLPFFRINSKKKCFSVGSIDYLERNIDTHIGRVLNVDAKGIYVSTPEGYVILSDIKDEKGIVIDYSFFKIGTFLD